MKRNMAKYLLIVLCLSMLAFTVVLTAAPAAMAGTGALRVGWIVYNGDWNGDPSAPYNLANQLALRTGREATVDFVSLDSVENLRNYDFLILTGHNYFSFNDTERAALKAYLDGCGLLFIDDCNNAIDYGFEESVRAEIANMFGMGMTPIPADHAVFSSFYSLTATPPTEWNGEPLEGIIINGETKVIYSDNDYTCGWEDYAMPFTIENSYEVAVNVATYAASGNQCVLTVGIDIKPGSFPNSINLGENGSVPVAVLGAAGFDASRINPVTLSLAGAPILRKKNGTPMASLEDVNGDGILDMVFHVKAAELKLTPSDTTATATGATVTKRRIAGSDSVNIVR